MKISEFDRGWRCGAGLMIAHLEREDNGCVAAQEAYEMVGLTVAQYKSAGLGNYDLRELRRIESRQQR